jgi:hypothetical protein
LKQVRLLLLALAALAAASSPAASADAPEYAIKGTYLYKFGPFVEWPESAFDGPESPLQVCIVGDDPFGPQLAQAAQGQRVGMHPIAVRHLEMATRGAPCHVMFLAGSATQSVAEALEVMHGAPVLTVTDGSDTRARGIITFLLENNRVRFEIDDGAAAQNHLVISSELLRLARVVRPRPAGAAP